MATPGSFPSAWDTGAMQQQKSRGDRESPWNSPLWNSEFGPARPTPEAQVGAPQRNQPPEHLGHLGWCLHGFEGFDDPPV